MTLFFRSAVYRSATAIVIEFFDVAAVDDYAKLFVEADENKHGHLQRHELASAAVNLGVSLAVLELPDGQVDQKTFVAKCTQLLGAERKVVLKFMKVRVSSSCAVFSLPFFSRLPRAAPYVHGQPV